MTRTTLLTEGAARYVVGRVQARKRDERQYGDHLEALKRQHSDNPNGRPMGGDYVAGTVDGRQVRYCMTNRDTEQVRRSERKTLTTTVDGGHRPLRAYTVGILTEDGPVWSHTIWRTAGRVTASQDNGRKGGRPAKSGATMTGAERVALSRWRKRATAEGYVCPEHGANLKPCTTECRTQALGLTEAAEPKPVELAASADRGW